MAICIPTYRRPIFLGRLLQSVTELRADGLSTWTVVVDNDATGSAESTVRPFMGRIPGLVYEIEPERGISAARNRLVSIAGRLGAEYVAFVDDDEWVEPSWLTNQVRMALKQKAVVVGGPVLPEFDDEVPRWLRKGGYFNRRRHPHGRPVKLLATSNLLVRRAWLDRLDGPFDRRFDLTGGGDAHMLERLHRLGARMVWSERAVVHERVPASRGTVRWILERRCRIGMTNARRFSLLNPGLRRRATRIRQALARIMAELILLPRALIRGGRHRRRDTLRILCRCASDVGLLLGSLGFSYEAYRRIQGR